MELEKDRLVVSYLFRCAAGAAPEELALGIACEQTVELPLDSVPERLRREVVGRVEEVARRSEETWHCRVSYSRELLAADLTQVLNLLFGNISMKTGIRVDGVEWPESLLADLPGPRFGIAGLRRLAGVEATRPMSCAVLKPVGLTAPELAELAGSFARGGIDIVKDDHSLADQPPAPFAERLARCREAVGDALYFPNVTAPAGVLEERVAMARAAGCCGVLVSPLVVGLDTVRRLAVSAGVAILGHPALAGGFLGASHGLAHDLLLGQLFRMAGCDGVIYPNPGGRFRFTDEECEAIRRALTAPLGGLLPAIPIPAGGIDLARVPEWARRFGPDTMFLLGGSLYEQERPEEAARTFSRGLARAGSEGS